MDELRPEQRAIRALSEEEYARAGELYSTSARGILSGHGRTGRGAYEGRERTSAGRALANLTRSAVCHRIASGDAGDPAGRATYVAAEGVAVAGELRYVLETPVERAACHEFVGDLRAVVDDHRADEAYDAAEEAYEDLDTDDPAGETGRPLLQAGTELLTHLSRPDDVGWDDIHGSGGEDALVRRVRTRRARLPAFAEERVRRGKLHAPRGSTEYGTGRYECPECGSDDVNYVAETQLCLRCSAPTNPV